MQDKKRSGTTALAGFTTLGLEPQIVTALTALGYEEPTPIQRAAIPPLLAGRDFLGQAATGTGKTAAFALPLLQSIHTVAKPKRDHTSALVLTPTRELAVQVAEAIHTYGRGLGITVLPIYGGADMRQQLRVLARGVDVVVATPGRAVDHIRRRSLSLRDVRMVVLDEADEMLDMGFADDLELILGETAAERQTALFSATMAPRVSAVADRHLKNPVRVTIAREATVPGSIPRVRQVAYVVPQAYKAETLGRVLEIEGPPSALIFCRTRTEVDVLTETLRGRGYRTEALHGGMSQEQRDRVMKHFRANTTQLLVATDVAARGLNIAHLACVVNYDVPTSPEAYVHRIGRTGRAGREGVAVTLVQPRERTYLRTLERSTKQTIEIAPAPTVADLRVHRIDLTRTLVREILREGNLGVFYEVADSLTDGPLSARDVAAAALKAAHEARGSTAEADVDIPVYDVSDSGRPKPVGVFGKHGDTTRKTGKHSKRHRGTLNSRTSSPSPRHAKAGRTKTAAAYAKTKKGRRTSEGRSTSSRREYGR